MSFAFLYLIWTENMAVEGSFAFKTLCVSVIILDERRLDSLFRLQC